MAIYQKKAIAIIEDNLYDSIVFYKSVLDNKDFHTGLNHIKLIPLSDLSATIPADRIDDYGVCFYLFERINTTDEYLACCSQILQSNNIDNIMLFCQDRNKPFDFPKGSYDKIINYGIVCDLYLDSENLATDVSRQHTERCIKLLSLLTTLCAVEERAFSRKQIAVQIKLNYKAVFCAAMHKCLEFSEEIKKKEHRISQCKDKITELEHKKPLHYSCKHFSEIPEIKLPDIDISNPDLDNNLRILGNAYDECNSILNDSIDRDITIVRYAMTDLDSQQTADIIPDSLLAESPTPDNPVPVSNDLLKRTETDLETDAYLNIPEAIRIAKTFSNVKKPRFKDFLIACGFGLSAFILLIASVYLISTLQNRASFSNSELLIVFLVPVGLIILSALMGFIINKIDFGKIRKVLKEISAAIKTIKTRLAIIISQVRKYLNTFITVYCNYHTRDYYIASLRKAIESLVNEKKQLFLSQSVYQTLCDVMEQSHNEGVTQCDTKAEPNLCQNDNDLLYTMSFDSADDFLSSQISHIDEEQEKPKCTSLSDKYTTAKGCVEYIGNYSETEISGNECEPFRNISVPWISEISFDLRGTGGNI
ncbi:MAG: hypothetical protein E7563_00730 [Ruminococcaceae bacterium]|nr:hypothetical protein [Oscillospiraceae bacterium]